MLIKLHASIRRLLLLAFIFTVTACQQSSTPQKTVTRADSASLSGDYATMRAKQVSNVGYQLSLTVDDKNESFSAINQINFTLMANNHNPLTIDFSEGDLSKLIINGIETDINYEHWFITIPAAKLQAGNNQITIHYSRPFATDGSGFHRFKDPEDGSVYLYTDFEPYDANKLFPIFDQPDLKATYTLDVKAPKHWKIISTSRESKVETSEQSNHWFFPETKKISSYVFSVHAGDYQVWEDTYKDKNFEIPLRLFARKKLAQYVKTDEWFTPTKQSFAFFNEYFDIAYPFDKYDQIVVPDFNSGAMENVAAVTFNEGYISRGDKSTQAKMSLANVIAHEMAHMWFGDLVTMRWWNGLWLNESFATYMANLEIAEASDFENNWDVFYSRTKQWAYRTDDSVNTHAIELPVATTGDALSNFDGITYGKGASVLKQLPFYLGEENFRTGVRNYLKKFSYANTDLDDFMEELGKAANKDLTQWTKDWLYEAGLNTIEVSFQCEESKISEMNILQTAIEAYPTLREQRVQVGLYNVTNGSMSLTNAVPVTYKGRNTSVTDAIGQTCPDLVYPNEADWGYVKVNLDQKSLTAVNQHISHINNITTRLMLWQSLSDSVRDAKLSAETLVDFAITNIASENNYNVVSKISSSLTAALGYLDTATRLGQHNYSAKHLEVEYLFYSLLNNAKAGSDEQKLWYSQFLRTVESKENLQTLEDILDEKITFKGLKIDQDKRWNLVVALNKYQAGQYLKKLDDEKLKDQSDSGVKNAILAEVIRPEADIKKKWFDVIVNNPEKLKLSTLRYIMFGLFPAEQKEFHTPYKEQILKHVIKLNEGTDLRMLSGFTGLIPTTCTSISQKELSGLVEEFKDMKPQALKRVKSKHEAIERCLKVLKQLN
jgi:aminopeptidase N